ncbi:adenine phosphoribosyltransferase 1-like isoform X2 [Gossypium australe]|uniref:adenine phosphoribosyltransferase n=1 Tax=Gossypium australe TaxID=47621 RepID=A0A5B6X4T0_9ROSI|nr:adenine phosphoribosyltransferase 1-like isoform X2 [Gossypium australe]
MLQRALIFSSSNPICSQLSATAPPDNTVFPKRNGGWVIPFSSYQLPAFRLRNYRRTLLPPLCSGNVLFFYSPHGSAANRPNMASQDEQDPRISNISSAIRVIPDFPKPGIIFQDITTLLLDTKAFRDTIDLFVERYRGKDISVVAGKSCALHREQLPPKASQFTRDEMESLAAFHDEDWDSFKRIESLLRSSSALDSHFHYKSRESIEARGFIFGPPIALAIGAKFVPLRKPNKLPGEVLSEEYSLEYGKDTMEMHVDAVKVGERALIIDDLVATGGTLSAAIRLLERVGVHIVECACVIELPELKGRERLGEKPLFVLRVWRTKLYVPACKDG